MATWPATLPAPLLDGYGVNPAEQVVRSDMESGAPRARRRSTARNDHVPVNWRMTDAQFAIFRAWFDDDAEAAGGAAWFSISLPIGNGGFSTVEARFAAIYKSSALPGLNWQVNATLQVR